MKKLALLVVVVGFTCLFTSAAFGDTLHVPAGYPTIQAGIDAASSGDTVQVAPGTYYEHITMKSGVVIQGAGAGDNPSIHSIIDGVGTGTVVTANGVDSAAKLDGFKITNGGDLHGGGMYNNSSSPTVTNCTFSENSADEVGGGMYNDSSSPTVTNCTFSGNSAYDGGGMANWNSSPTVTNCTFSGNSAYDGGGMYNNSSSPTVTNCTFSENSADGYGGGMNNNSSSPMVANCTFSNNTSTASGGGMRNGINCSPMVANCTFSGNQAGGYGGGLSNYSSSPTVTNCTFSGNSAGSYGGGGMGNWDASPTVTNCTFSGNYSAGSYGGGMSNNYGSSPTVTNCTFSGNSAISHGGGMGNYNSARPKVTNCILWGDTPGEIWDASSSPVVTYSDIQGGYAGTGNINADPMFLDPDGLDSIPGTEDDDYHLVADSPCIDTGTSSGAPSTDLEGNIRPQGAGYDMGAYESPFTKPKAMPWILLLLGD